MKNYIIASDFGKIHTLSIVTKNGFVFDIKKSKNKDVLEGFVKKNDMKSIENRLIVTHSWLDDLKNKKAFYLHVKNDFKKLNLNLDKIFRL